MESFGKWSYQLLSPSQVAIGSYPNTSEKTEGAWKVRVNIRGRDAQSLQAAVSALKEHIPELLTEEP
eukprot:1159109-Pelagomonas_calceolata.AAC.7